MDLINTSSNILMVINITKIIAINKIKPYSHKKIQKGKTTKLIFKNKNAIFLHNALEIN